MQNACIFPVGTAPACTFAQESLRQEGIRIVDHPSPEVTHLLLDVPSFRPDGQLRGGGDAGQLLEMLPEDVTVIGGQLDGLGNVRKMDLLKDPGYLVENAAITAECALGIAWPLLKVAFRDCPSLILGWGRIGKCLGQLLKATGAPVTVAARKEADRAMLRALGYEAVDFAKAADLLPKMGLVINTVPSPVLDVRGTEGVKLDLASKMGLLGGGVVWARGLPGIHAPESSGRLMADTILKRLKEDLL